MLLQLLIAGGLANVIRHYRQSQEQKTDPQTALSSVEKQKKSSIVPMPQNKEILEIQAVQQDFIVSSVSLGLSILGVIYPVALLLSIPGWIYVSMPAFKQAFYLTKNRKVDVNTIFTITFIGCFSAGFIFTGNLAAFFYVLSKKLFLKLKRDSKESLIDIFSQHPKYVWVVVGDIEVKTPFEALKQGDIVVVGAGETIPADGIVTEGYANVDQHILTGESQPQEKELDSQVFAATIVLAGKIYFKVEKAGKASSAAQIGQILNQTTHYKTAGQAKAEALTQKTLVPTLITGGLALPFLGPIGAITVVNSHFGYRMSVVSSIVSLTYLQIIARQGILIKNGEVLDLLPKVDTIVFDKTGTLTIAQPTLGRIHLQQGYSEEEVLSLAAAAEYKQTHPIALTILHAARQRKLVVPAVEERAYQIGYGLNVVVDGQQIWLGSLRFIERENIVIPDHFRTVAAVADSEGYSLVFLARDDEVLGAIELLPTVRLDAKDMVQSLKDQQLVKHFYIVSGDNDAPTRQLADELGIENYYAGVLPQDKAKIVAELQDSGKTVCYIGDGINDSIALKKAQVSISLRGASTIATDTAQIILMNENLMQLTHLFESARDFEKTMNNASSSILAPSILSVGGVFLLGFNLFDTIMLKQVGLTIGLGIASHPLLQQKKIQDKDKH
jgi:Cu2+-exporting ATPase